MKDKNRILKIRLDERPEAIELQYDKKENVLNYGKPTQFFNIKGVEEDDKKIVITLEKQDMKKRSKRVEAISKELAKAVNPKELMDDVLSALDEHELKEVHDRVIKKKAKVKAEEGCYLLSIGGRKGRPSKLYLRD